jgi:uncharacterized protein (TIGR00255 family)
MTGFGRGRAEARGGHVTAEVRTVNGRTLDVRVRAPELLADLQFAAEQRIRKRLVRGRCEVTLRLEGTVGQARLDRDRARAVISDLGDIARELGDTSPVSMSVLASVPDVFVVDAHDREAVHAAAGEAIELAMQALEHDRAREGAALGGDLRARAAALRALCLRIAQRAPDVVASSKARLSKRLTELAEGATLDTARLATELAVAAQRLDVAEELTRFEAHLDQLDALLSVGPDGNGIGRRLDFLLQELGREASTMCAKTPDVALTREIIELRAELERVREQVQNVE